MIQHLVRRIKNDNTIITAAPGNGTSSLTQAIVNELCYDHTVLYYNPTSDVNRQYVQKHYPNMFNNCHVMNGEMEYFINNVIETNFIYDYVVIDPADMWAAMEIRDLVKMANMNDCKLICTSQIRQNPGTGKPYSTIEIKNKTYADSGEIMFANSAWIRNVTEPNELYKSKYVDIFDMYRIGNHYDDRFLIRFDKKEGNVI